MKNDPKKRFVRLLGCLLALIQLMILMGCQELDPVPPDKTQTVPIETTAALDVHAQAEHMLGVIKTLDPVQLIPWLSKKSLQLYPEATIIERQNKIYQALQVRSIDFINLKKMDRASDQQTTVFTADMLFDTAYGPFSRPTSLTFSQVEQTNVWRLDWTPSVIMPGLTQKNELYIETMTAERGKILDRNGVVLAQDDQGMIVGAVAGKLDAAHYPEIAALLEMTVDQVKARMSQRWVRDGMFVPLKTQYRFQPEQLNKLPEYGLQMQYEPMRVYPEDKVTAHLVGYTAKITAEEKKKEQYKDYDDNDLIGKRGIENLFETRLKPKKGFRVILTGPENKIIVENPAQKGEDIKLTIDVRLQQAIYNTLAETDATVTLLDPRNGDILAWVSTPAFSPNQFAHGISHADYQALTGDSRKPLLNKFTLRQAPGSTQKLLTSVIALNNGSLTADSRKTINGMRWSPGASWGSYTVKRVREYNNPMSLTQAIEFSDNIFFAQTALDLGGSGFIEGMVNLGITEKVPVEYPVDTARISKSGTLSNGSTLLADSGYGQGQLQITPLQLTSVYGGLVNKGTMMSPRLLMETEPRVWRNQITSAANLALLQEAMRRVVSVTNQRSMERDYAVLAGKTGTAEHGSGASKGTNGLLVGYDQKNPTWVLSLVMFNTHLANDVTLTPRTFSILVDALYPNGQYMGKPTE